MSIKYYLMSKGLYSFEGFYQQKIEQVIDLTELIYNKPDINVLEIGFNIGFSSELFLNNNDSLTLTSFDLGTHEYNTIAKEYIDSTYPNRHTLILGNPIETIPKFINQNINETFDILFINGCQDYTTTKKYIDDCKNLVNENSIIILDNTIFTEEWETECTIGPTKIWTEYLQENKIVEINRKEYSIGRGMSWGNYVL